MEKIDKYIYYIVKQPYDNEIKETRKLPGIFKVLDNSNRIIFSLTDSNQGEGPFESLYDLKRKSSIFNLIKLQKHRDKITKNKNIEILEDALFTEVGFTYAKSFVDSFAHIIIGKISKRKLKGVHFYNPDQIQIIERIRNDEATGVWSAKIRKKDIISGEWIEKDEISNFFPESWSVAKTFWECYCAYQSRIHERGHIYYSNTKCGVRVRFIINKEDKIITFYPQFND